MKQSAWTGALALAGGILLAAPAGASQRSEEASTEFAIARSVRRELSALPYYGIFDLLTYEVSDTGVVTLGGYVLHAPLKAVAEKVVRRIEGVRDVENRIEELLPGSSLDDDVRGAAYRAIYSDPSLSRYATPDEGLATPQPRLHTWGRGFRSWGTFGEPRWRGRPYLGMEPVGKYAIHVIVTNGHLTLVGVVNNQADKDLAGIKASGLDGAPKVTNDLQVESAPKPK